MEHHIAAVPSLAELQDVAARFGVALDSEAEALTLAYLRDLARWNQTTSLIQAQSADELLVRHVAEGWLAARLVPAGEGLRLLDIGSGGGIPALPLRMVRRDLRVTLLEPRQRKAAFLEAVTRTYPAPPVAVRSQRLEDLAVSPEWDVISFRGIKIEPQALRGLLAPGGRVLRFPGNPDEVRSAWVGQGFHLVASEPLPTRPLEVQAWEP